MFSLKIGNQMVKKRDKAIAKAFALTSEDLEHVQNIKERCLDKKIVLNDSAVVRVALDIAANINEKVLIEYSKKAKKIIVGRPKSIDKCL